MWAGVAQKALMTALTEWQSSPRLWSSSLELVSEMEMTIFLMITVQ